MFEHARDHLDNYRALVGGGGAVSLSAIRTMLSDLVRKDLAAGADKSSADAIPREIAIQFVVGTYMAVLTWWLDGGAKQAPKRVDALFRRLTTKGVMSSQQQ
jgi:hypothetical protein